MSNANKPTAAQHTPGPWVRHDTADYAEIYCASSVLPTQALALVAAGPDANLIAAAPKLLAIAQRWAALDGGSWDVQRHASEKAELIRDTHAAIADATVGER